LNGHSYRSHSFLGVKPPALALALRTLVAQSRATRRTELFIETPYRNAALLQAMAETLEAKTRVCIAADLTLPTETIESRTAREWRRENVERFDKRPAIFLLTA
jgi:16S rRNA (cytidine1402-2'-O)-methyltransferase